MTATERPPAWPAPPPPPPSRRKPWPYVAIGIAAILVALIGIGAVMSVDPTKHDDAYYIDKATHLVLTQADLPSSFTRFTDGYQVRGPSSDEGLELSRCGGDPNPTQLYVGQMGDGFSRGTEVVGTTALYTPNMDDADSDFETFRDPKYAACMRDQRQGEVSERMRDFPDANVQTTVEPLADLTIGDDTFALRETVTLRLTPERAAQVGAPGTEIHVYRDRVYIRHGLALLQATFATGATKDFRGQDAAPFDATLERALVDRLREKVRDA